MTSSSPRLLFLLSSLEPGRDGVGDYTRSLAEACQEQGAECALIALGDPFIQTAREETTQTGLKCLRLPNSLTWSERQQSASAFSKAFAPTWTSLQFVSYAYHPKGMVPQELIRLLAGLCTPLRQVMMHEIWIGVSRGSSFKDRLIGFVQRHQIQALLRELKPQVLHTSNASFAGLLRAQGFDTQILPLFGNLPVEPAPAIDPDITAPWIQEPGRHLVGLCFGTLHPQWQARATADWFLRTAKNQGKTPSLLAVGRLGGHAPAVLEPFRRAGIRIVETGELPPTKASLAMQAADFGIAAHPWNLLGKSGAAAAMLDHGLPLLVPRDDWKARGLPPVIPQTNPLLLRLDQATPEKTELWLQGKRMPAPALPGVAALFLRSLDEEGNATR